MRRPVATVLATAALTAGLAGPGAGVALAQVGDDQEARYPGTTQPAGETLPDRQTTTPARGEVSPARGDVSDSRTTLPFTGGELVVLVAAGAGAVGAGAALVTATRRRSSQSA